MPLKTVLSLLFLSGTKVKCSSAFSPFVLNDASHMLSTVSLDRWKLQSCRGIGDIHISIFFWMLKEIQAIVKYIEISCLKWADYTWEH